MERLGTAVHEPSTTAQRRADALLELLRAGRSGAPAPASDRYTLHLVADVDALADRFGARTELLDGTPLATETLRRLACDCGVVRHLLRGDSQPLDVGSRTSVWTVAQRRAISLRERTEDGFVVAPAGTLGPPHGEVEAFPARPRRASRVRVDQAQSRIGEKVVVRVEVLMAADELVRAEFRPGRTARDDRQWLNLVIDGPRPTATAAQSAAASLRHRSGSTATPRGRRGGHGIASRWR